MPIQTFLRDREPSGATHFRGLAGAALADTMTVMTTGGTSDGGGGRSGSFTAGTQTFPCRVAPLGGEQSRLVGDRIDERATHFIYAQKSAISDAGQRVAVAGRGTFQVLAVHERSASWLTAFEVLKV